MGFFVIGCVYFYTCTHVFILDLSRMKLRLLFLLIWCCSAGVLWAQEPVDTNAFPIDDDEEIVKPPMNEDSKLGIKIGTGVTSLVGTEPNHPRPAMYLTGGIYGRFKIKPRWLIQTEGNFSYKGSNFANQTDEYSAIKAYYIDIPVMLLHGLDANNVCLLYTSPSPRDRTRSRMPSSA